VLRLVGLDERRVYDIVFHDLLARERLSVAAFDQIGIGCRAALVALSSSSSFQLHHIAFAAVFLDQLVNVIHAPAAAFGAFDTEHVELPSMSPKAR
jgi:hypothetical protein